MLLIRRRRRGRPGWLDADTGRWYPVVAGASGRTLNWKGTTATFATASNWVDQATGLAPASGPDAGDDCRWGIGTGATNNPCTTAAGSACRSVFVDNSYTGTLTLVNSTTALSVGDGSGGALTFGTGMTLTNAGNVARINFVSTSNNGGTGWAVTFNGKTPANVTFNGSGGLWIFQDALSLPGTATSEFVVQAGEVRTNGKTVTFTTTAAQLLVNGGTLTTGASTFNFATTTAVSFWSRTSGTVNGAGSTIVLTAASANTRTFAGGGQTYGTLTYTVAGSTGQLTITGANTFAAINFSDATNARTLALPAGVTTTCPTLSGIAGTAGKLMTVTGGAGATLAASSGAAMNYVSVDHVTATPTNDVYATNSTDGGSNSGIVFNPTVSVAGVASNLALSSPAGTISVEVAGTPSNVAFTAPSGAVSVVIAGAAANIALTSPAGTITVGVAGSPSGLMFSSPTGAVTIEVEGASSALAFTAPTGSVTIEIGGQPSTLDLSSPAGTVGIEIEGQPSNLTFTSPPGVVTAEAGGDTDVIGEPTEIAFTSPAGTIGLGVAGQPSHLTLTSPAGTVGVEIAGQASGLTLTSPAGTISGGLEACIHVTAGPEGWHATLGPEVYKATQGRPYWAATIGECE